jgi:CRP-like cAMP-binding protein
LRFRRKTRDAKLKLLGGVALFSACSKADLGRIAALVEEIEVPEGKVLTRQGEPGRECFIVCNGRARAKIRGRKRGITLGPGSFFGEMSLLDGGPRSATVTAESDMYLLVLDSRSFSSLVEDIPTVGRKVMRVMAERLRASERDRPTH